MHFLKNEIVSDSNKVSGKIKTKSFESSCSFFGNNFIFINLANIQYDFTIILEKCSLVLTKIFLKKIIIQFIFLSKLTILYIGKV